MTALQAFIGILATIGLMIVLATVMVLAFDAANAIERAWRNWRFERDYEPVVEKWDRVLVETWRRKP